MCYATCAENLRGSTLLLVRLDDGSLLQGDKEKSEKHQTLSLQKLEGSTGSGDCLHLLSEGSGEDPLKPS